MWKNQKVVGALLRNMRAQTQHCCFRALVLPLAWRSPSLRDCPRQGFAGGMEPLGKAVDGYATGTGRRAGAYRHSIPGRSRVRFRNFWMRCTTTRESEDAMAPCAGAFITMRRIPAYISRISSWSLGRNTRGSTIDLRLRTGSSKERVLSLVPESPKTRHFLYANRVERVDGPGN
jgi:hypothetical protein